MLEIILGKLPSRRLIYAKRLAALFFIYQRGFFVATGTPFVRSEIIYTRRIH